MAASNHRPADRRDLRPGAVPPIVRWVATALLAVAACSGRDERHEPAASASVAVPPSSAPVAPKPPARPAPASRAAVRDLTASGVPSDGAVLEVRPFRGRITTADPIGLALRIRRDTAQPDDPAWSRATIDWGSSLASLQFEVKRATGATHTFTLAGVAGAPRSWPVERFHPALFIDGVGLAEGAGPRRPWSAPAPELLAAPGAIEVTISGTFAIGSRRVPLRAGPLAITVVSPGPAAKPLVDVERAASEVARATWGAKGIPIPSHPTVEHDDGTLSVRFQRSGLPGGTGYDADLLEVWVDDAGRSVFVDAYAHFTCIAEGTLVATPDGEVPIEALTPGTAVDAFDVETHQRTTARVVRLDRAHADAVLRVGALRATAEHPVWAGGAWVPAGELRPGDALLSVGGVALPAPAIELAAPTTVYDLEVTPPHTFFAGGVLVHNKAVHVPLGGDLPWGPLFWRRAALRR